MSLSGESGHDDRQLVRYLLHLLPDEEAERLDEMSLADDDVAWRLRVVENDLVDAYVRGSLSGETLARFEASYLSSERRRGKVRFAGSFLGAVDRGAGPAGTDAGRPSVRRPLAAHGTASDAAPYRRIAPRSKATWSLAAAAALLLVASASLFVRDVELRQGLREAQVQRALLDRQLADQRAATTESAKEVDRLRASIAAQHAAGPKPADAAPAASRVLATALVLLPQTRGVGPIPTLSIPAGADRVAFELRLESDRFSRYQVALKDPATNHAVWHSGELTVKTPGDRSAVFVTVPAVMLKPQHYALDLIGLGAAGAEENVGSYAVQILRR
jgi:hypothetical protein